MPGMDYTLFMGGETTAAGLMTMPQEAAPNGRAGELERLRRVKDVAAATGKVKRRRDRHM